MTLEHGGGRKVRERKVTRAKKVAEGGQRAIDPKHLEERKEKFQSVKPMNDLQAEYIRFCWESPVVIATGFAGSSKSYIPTCVAAEKWYLGEIDKIYLIRPATSSSKSLGYFSGSLVEKAKNWLAPILDTLYEKLGRNVTELAIESGAIEFIPLEIVKGRSLKNCYIICDEAEDLTVKEFVKVVTRLGENATMVFAGDILQTDLKEENGLSLALKMKEEDVNLPWSFVDFNRPSDIVRSKATREAILAFRRRGLM